MDAKQILLDRIQVLDRDLRAARDRLQAEEIPPFRDGGHFLAAFIFDRPLGLANPWASPPPKADPPL